MTRRQFPTDPLDRALLQAVLDAPADDEPRLVYADRLIERGDPRGELIVVQCTLARLERAGETESDAYTAAKLRESTLEPRVTDDWTHQFGGDHGVLEFEPSKLRAALREVKPTDDAPSWPRAGDPHPRLAPAIRRVRWGDRE